MITAGLCFSKSLEMAASSVLGELFLLKAIT